MTMRTAEVIDLQSYRRRRAQPDRPARAEAPFPVLTLQPVLVWTPFWGFVPMMVPGVSSHGA